MSMNNVRQPEGHTRGDDVLSTAMEGIEKEGGRDAEGRTRLPETDEGQTSRET